MEGCDVGVGESGCTRVFVVVADGTFSMAGHIWEAVLNCFRRIWNARVSEKSRGAMACRRDVTHLFRERTYLGTKMGLWEGNECLRVYPCTHGYVMTYVVGKAGGTYKKLRTEITFNLLPLFILQPPPTTQTQICNLIQDHGTTQKEKWTSAIDSVPIETSNTLHITSKNIVHYDNRTEINSFHRCERAPLDTEPNAHSIHCWQLKNTYSPYHTHKQCPKQLHMCQHLQWNTKSLPTLLLPLHTYCVLPTFHFQNNTWGIPTFPPIRETTTRGTNPNIHTVFIKRNTSPLNMWPTPQMDVVGCSVALKLFYLSLPAPKSPLHSIFTTWGVSCQLRLKLLHMLHFVYNFVYFTWNKIFSLHKTWLCGGSFYNKLPKHVSHCTTWLIWVCVSVTNYCTAIFRHHLTPHVTPWAYAPPVRPEVQSRKIEALSCLEIIPGRRKCRPHCLYLPRWHPSSTPTSSTTPCIGSTCV